MWSYAGNVSFAVGATDCRASAGLIAAAVSREQLNELYVKNGTLLILKDGKAKAAYKVSQTGGSQEPFRVHFAASPGKKPVNDTLVIAADLAASIEGGFEGAEHILFGYKGGAFRGTDGGYLYVVDVVAAVGAEDAVSKLSVVQWSTGQVRPALENATVMELADFVKNFIGEPLDAPAQETIGVGEMPTLACVLAASSLSIVVGPGLGHGSTDQVALDVCWIDILGTPG